MSSLRNRGAWRTDSEMPHMVWWQVQSSTTARWLWTITVCLLGLYKVDSRSKHYRNKLSIFFFSLPDNKDDQQTGKEAKATSAKWPVDSVWDFGFSLFHWSLIDLVGKISIQPLQSEVVGGLEPMGRYPYYVKRTFWKCKWQYGYKMICWPIQIQIW